MGILLIIAVLFAIGAVAGYLLGMAWPQPRTGEHREETGAASGQGAGLHAIGARAEAGRRERMSKPHPQRLTASDRAGSVAEWERIQARFFDEPSAAVREADRLVADVMEARGYTVRDLDAWVEDFSVNHPEVAESFLSAHAVSLRNEQGRADTEELRKAVVYYRAVLSELLGEEPLRRAA